MANPLIGYPNRVDDATDLALGDWNASLPLANVQDDDFGLVARSSDATTASTVMGFDLGAAYSIKTIGVVLPNASLSATVTISADDASDFSSVDYAPGAENVYPTTYFPASTAFYGETVSGAVTTELWNEGLRLDYIHIPTTAQAYRYWRLLITDTGNADGYVEVARVFISSAFQPSVTWNSGVQLGYRRVTSERITDSASRRATDSPAWREIVGTLGLLPENEAMIQMIDLHRRIGTTGQVLHVFDPDDTTHLQRRSFIGTLFEPELMSIAAPFWADYKFGIREVI